MTFMYMPRGCSATQVALGLVLALSLGAGCRSRPAPAGPRIAFAATTHDFGRALAGERLEHRFALRNEGDQPLVLGALSTSCGCTTARPEQRTVAPGAATHLAVAFDTRGYEGETRNTVSVMSNDARAPRTVLVLTAEVELPLGVEPRHFKLITDDPRHHGQRIWLTGRYAAQARPRVHHFEGDAASGKIVGVRTIEQSSDAGVRRGLELRLLRPDIAPGTGTVVLDTGLPEPAQLAIELAWGASVKLR